MSFQNADIKAIQPNPADYFTQPGARGSLIFEMSSSALKEFARCPQRWINGYESAESKSKDFGSLLDCLALTPGELEKRYSVQPETYQTTGMECPECKSVTDSKKCRACGVDRVEVTIDKPWSNQSATCAEWGDEQIKAGREIVSSKIFTSAKDATAKLLGDEVIAKFIADSDKQVWLAGEWHDEATGLIIPVKAMLDLVPRNDTEFYKCLGDLKTTRNAAIIPWQKQVFDMGYHIQAAFNFDLYMAARPKEDRCNFCFVVLENFAPWQPGKRIMSQAYIELGRAQYRKALANYAWCIKNGKWPDYDETDENVQGWSITEPTPWMENAVMFSPKYQMGDDAVPADENEPDEGDGDVVP